MAKPFLIAQVSDLHIKAGGKWLDAKLAQDPNKATLVLMHHPPFHTFIGHID